MNQNGSYTSCALLVKVCNLCIGGTSEARDNPMGVGKRARPALCATEIRLRIQTVDDGYDYDI